jgi:hypothetical protein
MYVNTLIEDGNTSEQFTLDLHCAHIHREKWDIVVRNIEILILATYIFKFVPLLICTFYTSMGFYKCVQVLL